MKLLNPFYGGKGSKMQHVHLVSMFLTLSLSLVCLLLYGLFFFFFSNLSGNQEGRKVEEERAQQNGFSLILTYTGTPEEKPSVSGL